MTFIRLIFMKDVRAQRFHLLLLLGLWCAIIFSSRGLAFSTQVTGDTASLLAFLLATGVLISSIRLVLGDPTGREFRFLLTRPVPGVAVGLAKVLFLTLFFILPYWIGIEVIRLGAKVPFSPLDHGLLLIQITAWLGVALAAVMLLGIYLRQWNRVLMAIVMIVIAGVVASNWVFMENFSHAARVHTAMQRMVNTIEYTRFLQFRTILAEVVFLLMALIAIGWRYSSKSLLPPVLITLGALAFSYFAYARLPFNLVRNWELQSDALHPLTPGQLGHIHLKLLPRAGFDSLHIIKGMVNGDYYVNLNQTVQLTGIEAPYFVQGRGYHAVITLRSGKTITTEFGSFPAYGGRGGLTPSMLAAVAGVQPPPADTGDSTLELICPIPKKFMREDLSGATIKGVVRVEVRRAYVAGWLPLRDKASLKGLRCRYEITHAEFSTEGVKVNLSRFQLPLTLRGDVSYTNDQEDFQWVALSALNQEMPLKPGATLLGHEGWDVGLQISKAELSYGVPLAEQPADTNTTTTSWASGAKLVFIGNTSCDQVSLPYEIDNVDLK